MEYGTLLSDFCMTEIFPNISVELELQQLALKYLEIYKQNYRQDGAHLDKAMNGFGGGWPESAFVDVRIFNPYAPSNSNSSTMYFTRSMRAS